MAGSKVFLSVFLENWLVIKKTSIRPNTYNDYSTVVKTHINPILGNTRLRDLTPNQIQSLYTMKMNTGTSPRTTIMIHAVIHCALEHALKIGLVGRNVADAVTRPRLPRKEMKTLDATQAMQLIQAAEGNRYQLLFWFAVTTGLRQGELFGLKWSDVNWQNCKIHVQRQVQRRKGGLEFCEPKSSTGRRVLAIGRNSIQKLRDHYNTQQKEIEQSGDKWSNLDLIFCTPLGTPLEPANVLKAYKRVLKSASLPDIRFHDLRHTAATLMLLEDINPKVVQERLGHSDISLTLNTYSHVLPSMQEEAAEKMDELLTPIDIGKELIRKPKIVKKDTNNS